MTEERTPVVVTEPAAVNGTHEDGRESYTGESVQVLRDAAHIRQRPGMYIGDTSTKGLHHLVYELVYNSVDEALAGFCNNIHLTIHHDGSVSVADDGRGIPVDLHPELQRPTLEVVLTTMGAGAKFDKRTYKTSAGLHGIGAKAVTALSEWTEARVYRDGRVYSQEYERGKPTSEVKDIGAAGHRHGTTVQFMPDPEIFHDATFDYDTLEPRLRELAFLNKGIGFRLTDERTGKNETFKYEGGIHEFVEFLNRSEEVLHKPIYVDRTMDDVRVEVAFQYTTSEEERVRCYTNNAYNPVGGTHLSGFRSALTRTLNSYGTKAGVFKNGLTPIGEDFREGITGVVSVQHPDPQFESQNKIRLNNPEVEGIVAGVVGEHLAKYMEENPKDAQRIMKKVALAAEAREAASKAKKALRERKNILSGGGLPGKLMDCTSRERDRSELFLVEGDSAGGTAEGGRDRMYQAILPLRGKPLNVEKAGKGSAQMLANILKNEEIVSIMSAVGVDPETQDLEKLRYDKIVILTDADVDGQHIRTLLLTLFYRQFPRLIEEGHVYVARPPLYKVERKKEKARYVMKQEEINAELVARGLRGTKLQLLSADGKVPPRVLEGDQLAGLLRVLAELEGPLSIFERRGLNLSSFLGRGSAQGLPTFRVLLAGGEHWFHDMGQVDRFRREEGQRRGHELVVAEPGQSPANGNGHGPTFVVQELHEVKAIGRGLERLRELGLGATDLVEAPRVAGREPPVRYVLESGESKTALPHLRLLVGKVRELGEKGLTVKRFKGLGEMNDEELWETTLNPVTRTLLKVQLDEAGRHDDLFRTLMGERVEPRREFIQKHALEVKDIDYHGA
jgi:DNA gyrase subunit B